MNPAAPRPEWAAWKAAGDRAAHWNEQQSLIRARDRGLTFGFRVAYKAVKDGLEVGWGEGRCTRAEDAWNVVGGKFKPDYALARMAQTRGQSRALRQPLGFVVSLAGYATTPAEEVDGGAGADQPPPPEATIMLDDTGIAEAAGELQKVWPNYDGHGFMRVLARRFQDGVPEAAGVALRAWAWWAGRAPESELADAQTPPEEPTDALSPRRRRERPAHTRRHRRTRARTVPEAPTPASTTS